MSTLDNQTLSVNFFATLNNLLDLQSASSALSYAQSVGMSSGVGASQADRIFTDHRTIAASGTDDLDVNAGGLLDPLGVVFTVVRLKLIVVKAAAANTNNVVMGVGTNPITTILGGTTPTLNIRPGGLLVLAAPDAVAYGVTAATADILRFANSGAGTSVDYDVVLVGASA
jgi:hypothetical protein